MVFAQPGGVPAWYAAYLNNYFGLTGIYGLAPGANGNAVAGLTTYWVIFKGPSLEDQLTQDLLHHWFPIRFQFMVKQEKLLIRIYFNLAPTDGINNTPNH